MHPDGACYPDHQSKDDYRTPTDQVQEAMQEALLRVTDASFDVRIVDLLLQCESSGGLGPSRAVHDHPPLPGTTDSHLIATDCH